jgi:putative FmdB family regulatory protein
MPIYDFTCSRCGDFEANRRIAERDDAMSCPSCGLSVTRVAIAAPSYRGGGASADSENLAGGYGMRHIGSCLCCR